MSSNQDIIMPLTLVQLSKSVLKASELVIFGILFCFFVVTTSPLLPTKQWLASYAVVTGSMEPSIPVGTLAIVAKPTDGLLPQGTIIAFSDPSNTQRIILHRITQVLKSGTIVEYRTKGDNNNAEDLWLVQADQIKGQLRLAVPYLGYVIMWAKQPLGFGVLVGIPAVIVIFLQIKNIKDAITQEVQKKAHQVLLVKEEAEWRV